MNLGYTSGGRSPQPHRAGSEASQARWQYAQRRRRRAHGNEEATPDVSPLAFERIFSRDAIYQSFIQLREENGPSPGIDGIRYADLTRTEAGQIAKLLALTIKQARYRPRETRQVEIPKSGGNGTRTLRLAVIADRMVAKAACNALTPHFERIFCGGSWGFRRERSPMGMLADLEAHMARTDRWVLAIDDIRGAFDYVPITRTVEAHRRLLQNTGVAFAAEEDPERLLQLIDVLLRGDDPNAEVGIAQGSPYSPVALNVLLHELHDVPFSELDDVSWRRYADNLVYATDTVERGHEALRHATQLLAAVGMNLKGEPGNAVDLASGEQTELFHLRIRKEGASLAFELPDSAWDALASEVKEAWKSADPVRTGTACVIGWIGERGWLFSDGPAFVDRVLNLAASCGLREISPVALRERWSASGRHWRQMQQAARQLRDSAASQHPTATEFELPF